MKKRKLILTALCLSSVTAFALGIAACTQDGSDHEHTYSTAWSYDDDSHYHACTHEDCTSIKDDAPHDTAGDDGACSVCGYKETPAAHLHSWSNWTVTDENKPTATTEGKATRTCSASGDCEASLSDTEYTLPALTSEDYKITDDTADFGVAGEGTYNYSKNGVSVSFKAATPALIPQDFTITVSGASAGVTVKLGKYSATTNANGEATVKAEKKNYDVVVENDGYSFVAAKITPDNPTATVGLPTQVTGGNTESTAKELSTGLYTATIRAIADREVEDRYTISIPYFSVGTESAKTITVKILSENTTVSPNDAGYSMFTGVGESYSIVLEANESTLFNVVSNDDDVTQGYSFKVVFEVTESDPPEIGVYARPARLQNEVQSTMSVSDSTQKVYYSLDYATFGRYATVTFGDGVTVYSLGLSKSGTPTEVVSGTTVIDISEYAPAYLYAVSTGEDVTLKATVHIKDGMKQKPFSVTLDEDYSPEFDLVAGVREQWYKVDLTSGMYIIKPDAGHSVLELYNDVNGEAVNTASGGSSIVINVAATTTYYVKAQSSLNATYSFTVTTFSDADKGESPDQPLELSAGDYNIYTTRYYTFTATVTERVTITASGASGNVYFYQHADNTYDTTKLIGTVQRNSFTLLAVEGKTYYIRTTASADGGTMNVVLEPLAAHDHVITLSGAESNAGVTVKVMNGTEEVARGTTQADGKVTLSFIPGDYKIVLDNLPSGYGYFADYALTAINDDQTTNVGVTLYALKDYSLTVKLPDGTGAAGITVTFTNKVTGTFTAETDSNGVAKINQLPPMATNTAGALVASSYTVTFELPTSLKEDYTYTGAAISLTSTAPTNEVSLNGYLVYTFTFTDSAGGTLPEGTTITVKNGTTVVATATTDANGVATLTEKVVAGEYTILIGTDVEYATFTKTSLTQAQTAVTYEEFTGVKGAGTAGPLAQVIIDSTQIYNASTAGYYKISGAGIYTVSVDSDMQINWLYLNGWTTTKCVMTGSTITASRNTISLTIVEKDSSGIATKVSFTLGSDTDYVYIGVKGTGFANVTLEHSAP